MEFGVLGELIHVGGLMLGERQRWLESVKLCFDGVRPDVEYAIDELQPKLPIQVAPSDTLRYLEVEGVMLNTISGGMLKTLSYLERHAVAGVHTAGLVALISACPALHSLILRSVHGEEGEMETVPQLAIDLPTLTTLVVSNVSSSLRLAVLGVIHGDHLSRFRICHGYDMGAEQTVRLGLRPHSMLSAAIANSGADDVLITITNNDVLQLEAYSDRTKFDPSVDFRSYGVFEDVPGAGGWTASLNSYPHFAELAARLPPTELRLIESTTNSIDWSFDFLIHMPSVISIFISKPSPTTLYLFEEILAKRHLVDGEWAWACPKLDWVEFDYQDVVWNPPDRDEYSSRIEAALSKRQIQGKAAGLPVISCSLPEVTEEDD